MNAAHRRFLDDVKQGVSRHFENDRDKHTTFEAEVALLCAIVESMRVSHGPEETEKVLACLHAYVTRTRSQMDGALSLALMRLAQLEQERLGGG